MTDPRRSVGIFRLQLFRPSESFIANQASHFERSNPVFMGYTRAGREPWPSAEIVTPASPSMLRTAAALVRRDGRPILRALGSRKLALVHAHFSVDAVYALRLTAALKLPLVTTFHGYDVTRQDASLLFSGNPALAREVLHRRELQKKGALFLCVSEFIREAALKKGFPPDRTVVHYIGIDTKKLTARDDAGEPGLIVHVARLVEKKGTRYLIRAMPRILATEPKARLVILGDGRLRKELEREASALGVGAAVHFAGMVPNAQVLDQVRKASVMVVPSVIARNGDAEGFGIVNLEASAQGVPLVASASGGIKEALIDGETGFLTPERDVEAIAERIIRLLCNADLRRTIGDNARRFVTSRFDVASQSARLEGHYDEVLSGKWRGERND